MKELNNKELELIRKGLYELQRKVYKELEEDNYNNEDKENEYYQIEELYQRIEKIEEERESE
jgi:hypothetical protein